MPKKNWSAFIKRYRARNGLTQFRLADVVGVSQRTISRWENGQDQPSIELQKRLRDLEWTPPSQLLRGLAISVKHCPAPRALSRGRNFQLQAVSKPAIKKRPSVADLIGCDLVKIAQGVWQDILEDAVLQRSISNREVACILCTTRGVLNTHDPVKLGKFNTTIHYFFYEGTIYSDAISGPAPRNAPLGYTPVMMDEIDGLLKG